VRSETLPAVQLTLSTSVLQSTTGSESRSFTIAVPDTEAPAVDVRVVPDEGLLIACGGVGEPSDAAASSDACEVALDDILEVLVVPDGGLPTGDSASVHVFWGTQRRSVSYTFAATPMMFEPNGAPAGHYQGWATLERVGAGIVPSTVSPPSGITDTSGGVEAIDIAVPIAMDVFDTGSGLVVRIDDITRALTPDGELVAQLVDAGGGMSSFIADSKPFIDSSIATVADDSGAGFERLMARYGWRAGSVGSVDPGVEWPTVDAGRLAGGIFAMKLPVYFDNLRLPQRAPAAIWSLALVREGDVSSGATAPSAPSGEALVHPPALAAATSTEPTRWEALLEAKTAVGIEERARALVDGDSLGLCSDPGDMTEGYTREVGMRAMAHQFFGLSDGRFNPTRTGISVEGIVYQPDARGMVERATRAIRSRYDGLDEASETTQVVLEVGGLNSLFFSTAESSTSRVFAGQRRQSVPCAWNSFSSVAFTGPPTVNAADRVFVSVAHDGCSELARETGCTIEGTTREVIVPGIRLLLSGNTNPDVNGTWIGNSTFSGEPLFLSVRSCVMPRVPITCADAALCHSGDVGDGLLASPLVDGFSSETGDAVCEASPRSVGIEADENPADLRAGGLFAACFSELGELGSASSSGTDLYAALARGSCVNHLRLFAAIGAASDATRDGQLLGVTFDPEGTGSRLSHRLLVRWVQLLGYVATETLQQQDLAESLRRLPVIGIGTPPVSEDALRSSLAGWNLLLHPRFATLIDALDGAALASPDYRPVRFGQTLPADALSDPAIGLSAAILDAWRSQVELATRFVQKAQYRGTLDVFQEVGPVYRYGVAVTGLADELAARALAHCQATPGDCDDSTRPAWYGDYERARAKAGAAVQRLEGAVATLRSGRNPFGIEAGDLPLYFADDPETDAGRFFAISDYLVGASPSDLGAWAPPLIADAHAKLGAVRGQWVERQDRIVATQRDEQARESRIIATQVDYGERLISLCGRPGNLLPGDALAQWEQAHGRPFDGRDCYIDFSNSACYPQPQRTATLYRDAEAQFSVCLYDELKALGESPSYHDSQITAFADGCPASEVRYVAGGCGTSGTPCLSCTGSGAEVTATGVNFLDVRVEPSSNPALVQEAEATCRGMFPTAKVPLPRGSDVAGPMPASCFRGAIGEQAAALRSVQLEIDIARAEAEASQEAYRIAMDVCLKQKELVGDKLIMAREDHNKTMQGLRTAKAVMDSAASVAESISDCTGHVNNVDSTEAAKDAPVAAAGCAAEAAQAYAEIASIAIGAEMERLEDVLALDTLKTEVEGGYEVCKRDADHHTVNVVSQGLRIQQALADLDAANVAFSNLRIEADMVYIDGLATVEFEQGRRLNPLTQDLWLDETVASYRRSFRIAHRVTYLAVLAVEYEFQQSLGLRELALAAEVPDDLETVLQELRSLTAARSVFGSRPSTRKMVLSLRDDLLALTDLTGAPANFHEMTAVERLQNRLVAQSNKIFDESGTYLGTEIRFSLSPTGLGAVANSTEVFSQGLCAERLWSVNASILGPDELLVETEGTFTEMTIKKANTFFSQWCLADPDGPDLQGASVRPERNLFRDPESPGASFIETQLAALKGKNDSRALIQPSLNVAREDFETDAYENGASSQLAGRGLFGEYAIFFPAQAVSQAVGGVQTPGLDLSQVTDVLIRFDYVAAARQ